MKKNHTKKTQQKIVREVFERIENAVNRDEKNNIFFCLQSTGNRSRKSSRNQIFNFTG